MIDTVMIFPAIESGNAYTIAGLSGVANSSGTYVYTKNSPATGLISYDDSVIGSGFSAQLSCSSDQATRCFIHGIIMAAVAKEKHPANWQGVFCVL